MKTVPGGLLVVLDGIDGVGKTTQLELLRDKLQAERWAVETSRNLGGTPIGEALREVIKSHAERPPLTDVYISAAIQEALIDEINAKRKSGAIILMDRSPLSLAAYEMYGSKVAEDLVWQHVERGMIGLKPDLAIIYEADVETALRRAHQASEKADYFESKPLEYFQKVAHGYKQCAIRLEGITVIDANRPIEAIADDTYVFVQELLPK